MAESIALEAIETGKTEKQARYIKVKTLNTHQANDINDLADESIDEKSIIFTDKSSSYRGYC